MTKKLITFMGKPLPECPKCGKQHIGGIGKYRPCGEPLHPSLVEIVYR